MVREVVGRMQLEGRLMPQRNVALDDVVKLEFTADTEQLLGTTTERMLSHHLIARSQVGVDHAADGSLPVLLARQDAASGVWNIYPVEVTDRAGRAISGFTLEQVHRRAGYLGGERLEMLGDGHLLFPTNANTVYSGGHTPNIFMTR